MSKHKKSRNKEHFERAVGAMANSEQAGHERRREDSISVSGNDRIIMIHGSIDHDMAKTVVTKLHSLGEKYQGMTVEEKEKNPIFLYIDSGGGNVNAGMSIYDTMNHVQARYGLPIATLGFGANMSMASFLLCAGTPGYRAIMPNSNHMIHEPSIGGGGRATEHEVTNAAIQEVKERMMALYVAHTKMTYKQVKKLFDHTDDYLRPEECVKRGIVDFIQYPDAVIQMEKQNKVTYAPGIKEHLIRIAQKEREINETHLAFRNREPEQGIYRHLSR